MPPEPGDCNVVRVNSYGKSRPSGDHQHQQHQHQKEDSPPVQRGRSAEAADMEAAMAVAVRATHYDNRDSHTAPAAAADHSDDGSMHIDAPPASLRSGNSAPYLQHPAQSNYAAGANVHRVIFEGQGQSRQPALVSPACSIAGGHMSQHTA